MRKSLIITLILGAALMSCTKESPEQLNESLQVECYSRSASEKKVVEDFGMYVFSADGTPYPGVSNPVHVTYQSGWNFPPIRLNEDAKIYSFSPYTETTDCTSLNININNQTDYLACSGASTANKTKPSVSITMEHVLCKINVTIDGSSSCQVKLLNIPLTATYNLKTNKLTVGGSGDLTTSSSSVLICPASSQVLKMVITYNGKQYDYTESAKPYAAGKEYGINLTISDSKELVINGDVTITDWEQAGNYEGTVNEK